MDCLILHGAIPLSSSQDEKKSLRTKLLVKGFHDYFQSSYKDCCIAYGPHGKPYVSSNDNQYFNITNTSDPKYQLYHIAIAFSLQPIGIDMEHPRTISVSLATKLLSDQEQDFYHKAVDKQQFLLQYWTLKEAYTKYTGEGLTMDLSTLSFVSNDRNEFRLLNDPTLQFYHLSLNNHLFLSICSKTHLNIVYQSI